MTFWRNPDEEFRRQRKESQEVLTDSLVRPWAFEILSNVLDYLQAMRLEDKMVKDNSKVDAGLQLAIQRLKECGDAAQAARDKG